MPRAKKTLSNQPAQKVEAIKGQTYGEGLVQKQLQQSLPAPNMVGNAPTPSSGGAAPAQVDMPQENSQPKQPMDLAALKSQLQGQGGVLFAPDDQPNVPFNTQPTKQERENKLGAIMRELSAKTGDSIYAYLADKSRM
jgi:hypothetical protein